MCIIYNKLQIVNLIEVCILYFKNKYLAISNSSKYEMDQTRYFLNRYFIDVYREGNYLRRNYVTFQLHLHAVPQ